MRVIAAVDKNWAIGNKGQLLVSIPADQRFFRGETTGKTVVLGRKTMDTFPGGRPLKNRRNIILTRNAEYGIADAETVSCVEELLETIKDVPQDEVYVIGGQSVYEQLLPYCDEAYITKIDHVYQADAYFPCLDDDDEWECISVSEEETYWDLEYRFCIYRRRKSGKKDKKIPEGTKKIKDQERKENKMGVTTRDFGTTKAGEKVTLYRIENSKGMAVEAIDFGANIVSIFAADKDGRFDDVVLGFDNVAGYETNPCFFGSAIGRSANRIGGASFVINGKEYKLESNEDGNNLHSSFAHGYHKRMWKAAVNESDNSVRFSLESPDGDDGFPGNLKVAVTYRVNENNELEITYEGESDADTVFNMTNHSYFNLAGHKAGSAMGQKLWLKASAITEVTPESIPTGKIIPTKGTPFDFSEPRVIGDRINDDDPMLKIGGGYDHNFVIDRDSDGCIKIAELSDEKSGRKMSVYTDLPGVQFYAGNFIVPQTGKEGAQYDKRCGVCLETQFFPDAINKPQFKSSLLKAGEKFKSVTKYGF